MCLTDSVKRNALLVVFVLTVAAALYASDDAHKRATKIVVAIQRADYEGDRAALKRLYGELAPFLENRNLAVRVHYWRGFALWRRAINGFNDHVDSAELQEDLRQGLDEFNESAKQGPAFVDAKVGALSCLGFLAYAIYQQDAKNAEIQPLIERAQKLRAEIETTSSDDSRFLWVIGPMVWNTPPERGGGQAKAIEGYEKGLQILQKHQHPIHDSLEPSWGEPELLMSLAWSSLNQAKPDPLAAERYARSALELVPYWHYVRDILMPQIQGVLKPGHQEKRPL